MDMEDIIKGFLSKLDENGGEGSVATLVCGICISMRRFRNEKGPAIIPGIITEHVRVSYWARETEHSTQTLVLTKPSKMPNLVEVIVI